MEMADMERLIDSGKVRLKKHVRLTSQTRVEGMGDCWLVANYNGNSNAYTRVVANGKRHYIHRLVASIVYGEIPEGMSVSHLCELRNDKGSRKCVNPKHLIIESLQDNIKRSPTKNGRTYCVEHRYCRYRWTGTTKKVQ